MWQRKWRGWLVFGTMAFLPWVLANAVPLKVLAIGDSLTEEYDFEQPFSAPDSNPTNPNTMNWPEILADRRADHITMGSYDSSYLHYQDLRNAGFKYNYGVPGFKSSDWIDVCTSDIFDMLSGDVIVSLWYPTRVSLDENLGKVDVVVIFLGGNDLKSNYSGIFNDPTPPALLANVVSNVAWIHDYVRNLKPELPIIITTVPDIGATPEVSGIYTDPVKRAVARQRIATMNADLTAMALARGATVARIDELTDRIFDEVPLDINGTQFIFAPHPENPPLHLFCKDGFHPSTVSQALIANLLVDALNRATSAGIPLLENREILGPVLDLNPDQPYLDWAGGAGGMQDNPDGDGLPNLAEFVLGTSPLLADSPFFFGSGGLMTFTPSADGLKFAALTVMESESLTSWLPVPSGRIEVSPSGVWSVLPATTDSMFYRLSIAPRP